MPLLSTFGAASAIGWYPRSNMPTSINILLVGGGGPASVDSPGAGGRVTLRTNYAVTSGTYSWQSAVAGGTTQLVKISGANIGESLTAGPGTLSGRTSSSGSDINGVVTNVSSTRAASRPAQWGRYTNSTIDGWYGFGYVFTNAEPIISASSGVSSSGMFTEYPDNGGYEYYSDYNKTFLKASPTAAGYKEFAAAPEFNTVNNSGSAVFSNAGFGSGGQGVVSKTTGWDSATGDNGLPRGVYTPWGQYYNDASYFGGKIWSYYQTGGDWPRWFGTGQAYLNGTSYDWMSYGVIAISYPATFDKIPALNDGNSFYWLDTVRNKHVYYIYSSGVFTL